MVQASTFIAKVSRESSIMSFKEANPIADGNILIALRILSFMYSMIIKVSLTPDLALQLPLAYRQHEQNMLMLNLAVAEAIN